MRVSSGRSKKYAEAPPSTSSLATASPSEATLSAGAKRVLRSRLPITIAGMPCAFASARAAISHGVCGSGGFWCGSDASSEPRELSITITRTVPPRPAESNA
jgi:hypothetical protein